MVVKFVCTTIVVSDVTHSRLRHQPSPKVRLPYQARCQPANGARRPHKRERTPAQIGTTGVRGRKRYDEWKEATRSAIGGTRPPRTQRPKPRPSRHRIFSLHGKHPQVSVWRSQQYFSPPTQASGTSKQINIRRVEDVAEVDETPARAAQSMDRMTSLRVSLFSMTFSFVVCSVSDEVSGGTADTGTIRPAGWGVNG